VSAHDDLERLLAESPDAARERARTEFDRVAEGRPIVLFGAGGLGRRIARALAKIGEGAVAFADGNPATAGTTVEGLPVLLTTDAIARYGTSAVFVVTVWRSPASERMSDRVEHLKKLGAKHVTTFAALSWKHPAELLPYYSMDLPHQVLEAKAEIVRAFDLLADEASRQAFVAHLRLRLELDWAGLGPKATDPEYFAPDLFRLADDERFVDCGAFDGDTVRSFLGLLPRFRGRVHAFEPDPASFARLGAWREGQPAELRDRIEITRAGVGREHTRVSFAEGGGTGSAVGAGSGEIEVVPLDEATASMDPTLVKVDTEGYDIEVLEGARRLVSEKGPVLAVCVYHRQDHLWRIPLILSEMRAGYRLTLRSYCIDGWDLVLYAVPEHRRI
jgi:FkbM family methyltransferase